MTAPIYRPFINDEKTQIEYLLSDFAKRFQTCIPAKVVQVISRDTVKVSPTVLQSDSEGNPIDWADITTTVLTPFSGGLIISMPLAVGDTGWLVAADLDTSLFKKNKKSSQQVSYTRHLYQYGFFVPDAINGYTISDDDSGAIVISTLDGTTKIALSDGNIDIKSSNTLKINAKSVNITTGATSDVSIDGIDWKTHVHSGGTLSNSAGTVTGTTGSPTNVTP